MEKKIVLFICTHNSARSQMAEGYLRARYDNLFDVESAGTEVRAPACGSRDGRDRD